MDFADTLPKRNVVYQNRHQGLCYPELVEKYEALFLAHRGEYFGPNQECVSLPQFLTDVGYTGRWHPGPKVMDLDFLLPGTVIANFRTVKGKTTFPNKSGWHAALFDKFWRGAMLVNGLPCEFSMFDQFHGKPASLRGVAVLTPEWKKANSQFATPSNNALEFHVVVIP